LGAPFGEFSNYYELIMRFHIHIGKIKLRNVLKEDYDLFNSAKETEKYKEVCEMLIKKYNG
jgi:hypothetical protein